MKRPDDVMLWLLVGALVLPAYIVTLAGCVLLMLELVK